MAQGLSDVGEEFIIRHVFTEDVTKPGSLDVGLYNDTTDDLSDSEDLSDITTEPSGASYTRQTVSFGTTDMSASDVSGDWEVAIADQEFDVSDSSQTVDSWFLVINFTSSDKGDGSATDHVFARGGLGVTDDLSNFSGTRTYVDIGGSQT